MATSSKPAVPGPQAAGPALAGPDAELLALRPDFHRLRAAYYGVHTEDDRELSRVCEEFDTFCLRVGAMPAATTPEGLAFKAICALHQIYYCTNDEEFWDEGARGAIPCVCKLLRELIGDSFPLPPREEA